MAALDTLLIPRCPGQRLPVHHRLGRPRTARGNPAAPTGARIRGDRAARGPRLAGGWLAGAMTAVIGRRARSCSAAPGRPTAGAPDSTYRRTRRDRRSAAALPRPGHGDRARLQRGRQHRRHASARCSPATTRDVEVIVVDDGSTDDTAGDRARGCGCRTCGVIRAGQRRQAGRTQHRHRATPAATCWSWSTATPCSNPTRSAGSCSRSPTRRSAPVSGNTKVANRRGLLGRWQHLEYVIGFNLDRRMFDLGECMPTVPGAIGAFRREALTDVGGVSADTLAEDTDLTMAIIRAGWRVVYEPDAIAWTEAPATLRQLWRQRYRWCYGTMQAMWKHRTSLDRVRARPDASADAVCSYLLLFQVLLPLCRPSGRRVRRVRAALPAARAGRWRSGSASSPSRALTAAYALHLDREPYGPLWTLPLQQFVYRQLMYLVVVQSTVTALTGSRLRWHRMIRTGEADRVLANR